MVKTSNNLTNTESRLIQAIQTVNKSYNNPTHEIKQLVQENMIQLATLVEYYPDTLKAKCRLINTPNTIVDARIMQSGIGALFTQYTPAGEYNFKQETQEVIIKPREETKCLLLQINHKISDYIIIGFLYDEKTSFKPVDSGVNGVRVSNTCAVDDYYVGLENGVLRARVAELDIQTGVNNKYTPFDTGFDEKIKDLINRIEKINTFINQFYNEYTIFREDTNQKINTLTERVNKIEEWLILTLEERVTRLEQKIIIVDELDKRVTQLETEIKEIITPTLKNYEERIRALEKDKPIIKRLKIGRYNKEGEGELQDTESNIIMINKTNKETWGCQILDYKEGVDKSSVIFNINDASYPKTLDKDGKALA